MRAKGMSESDIAERLGKSRGGVTRALNPERYASYDTADAATRRAHRAAALRRRLSAWCRARNIAFSDDDLIELAQAIRGVDYIEGRAA